MGKTRIPAKIRDITYHSDAHAYLRSLPLEHHMEAFAQGTQREITLESLALVKAHRPDFHVFNEMLVQYPDPKAERKIGKVVPDNMVVIHDGPLDVDGYYAIELQPAKPFWVLEYVSKSNERKDYEDNMTKYETMLRVPYYLLFYPDNQDLSLFKYRKYKKAYSSVLANDNQRFPVTELELEVAILDGWVRFWFRGELLPLPADLQRELQTLREQLRTATDRATESERRAAEARLSADRERQAREAAVQELARARAEIESLRRRRNGA